MTTIAVSDRIKKWLDKVNRDLKLRCKSKNDLIEKLIAIAYNYKELKENPKVETPPLEDDTIKCINRIFHDGSFWCVVKPPKMVKLPTLDICKVCKARKMGLKDSTKIENEVKNAKERAWLKNPNKGFERYGMVYCQDAGMWVFPSKCEQCSNFNCDRKRQQILEKEKSKYE